jgi:DNA-binding NarL/FixJ family response regulator
LWLSQKGALHISGELGISEGTVRNIVKNIYTKLQVNERKQFVKKLTE